MAPNRSPWDAVVPVVLAVASAIGYWPIALQGRVFASFDTLVYFYPNAAYLAERVRAGQIPLWDPYLFAGVPFLANSQVGALYPPNWLYAIGPISAIYSLLFVGHVWLLAIGIYLIGRRSLGLSRAGSLYAAIAIALSGFVAGMSGHLNQLEALAWAPFAVVCVDRAVARLSWRLALFGSVPLALCAYAGHSQVLYMTGLVLVAVALSRAAQTTGPLRSMSRCQLLRLIAAMAITPVVAVLLASAQLLPTLELTGQSIRSAGLSFADAAAFSFPPQDALIGLLPTVNQPPPSTEWLGYVGLSALLFATWALLRRRSSEVVWLAALAVVGLVLALGQVTPLYRVVFELVPGFRLFRVPARWLTYWTCGVGLLAGVGLDRLLLDAAGTTGWPFGRRTWTKWLASSAHRFRHSLVQTWPFVAAALAAGILGLALVYRYRHLLARPTPATVGLWVATVVGVGLVARLARHRPGSAATLAVVLLGGELFVSSFGLPQQQAVWPDGVESTRATVDHLIAPKSDARVLALGDNTYDPGDLAELRRRLGDSLPAAARDAYITAVKHVEGLTPNLALRYGLRTIDGYDGGILPLSRFALLKSLFATQGPVVSDGRLRIQLKSAPDPRLLGWLDVRYLMMDRLRDRWIDGVYFDLGISQPLDPGVALDLPVPQTFSATTIGIALRGAQTTLPPGILDVVAGDWSVSLDPARLVGAASSVDSDVDPAQVRVWRLPFDRPTSVDSVRLTWRGEMPLVLRSVSLIDERTGANQTVPASPLYRLSLLGDMKIYDNQAVLPRAFLADGLSVQPDLRAVEASLRQPDWNPTGEAIASAGDVAPTLAFAESGLPGTVQFIQDAPESMVAETTASGRRVLVLTDSAYPGWRATVDGAETPILTVNLLFRGVLVPAGQHRVTMSYLPRTWSIGVAASLVAAAIVVLGLLWPTRRLFR